MEARYIDVHCHVQFGPYDADRDMLVTRMREEGVAGIVVGVDSSSSRNAIELVEKYEHLYASAGQHPNHVGDFDERLFRTLLRTHPKIVAVGECGLDYYRPTEINEEVKRAQAVLLEQHLALAAEFDKPLIIHARPSKGTQDAYQDLIRILQEAKKTRPNLRGDVPFFVGGTEEAAALTALGFTVSFTAVITFARDYDEVIRTLSLETILSETDSPYVAPASRRGTRNDPLAVMEVAAKIAEIRGEDPEAVRAALVKNALDLFALPGVTGS